jgi:hypothetical protein
MTEEQLRAAYEEEMSRIRVEQVLIENVVTLVNLGMRRTGLAPGTEAERDPEQVRLAIEGIRSQLPVVEQFAPQQVAPIRDALSEMQFAYVKIGGQPAAAQPADAAQQRATPEPPPAPKPGEAGPAQRSGRLWVPGQ